MNTLKRQSGLTIIELIIVIAIISLAIPTLFNLFFSMLRARAKTYVLQEVKRNGDIALNIMETLIKQRAIGIYSDQNLTNEVCLTSGSQYFYPTDGPLYYKDRDVVVFYFITEGANPTKIASHTASSTYDLTNQRALVSNFSLQCFRKSAFSPPIVRIDFDITSFSTSTTRQEENATIHYTTQVKLRN